MILKIKPISYNSYQMTLSITYHYSCMSIYIKALSILETDPLFISHGFALYLDLWLLIKINLFIVIGMRSPAFTSWLEEKLA